MSAVGYGIDFGTTNSAIAIAYDDGVDVVDVEPGVGLTTMLPSLIYLHRNGDRNAGTEAARQFMVTGSQKHQCSRCDLVEWHRGEPDTLCRTVARGGGCPDSRLLAAVKRDLANASFSGTHSWAVDFPIHELVAVVLRRLKAAADRACGQDVRRAVLGYPLAFPDAEGDRFRELQSIAVHRLEDAAYAAGFDDVQRMPEPQAAALVEEAESGLVMALDFGGGTFDVAIIEFTDEMQTAIALQGAAVGGERIDEDIFDAKIADALGLNTTFAALSGASLGMPAWMRRGFRSLAGTKHLMSSQDTAAWIREQAAKPGGAALNQLTELLYGGQAYSFYREIEQAKIALSTAEQSTISFHRAGIEVETTFTRAELDAIVSPYLRHIDLAIDRALDQAQVGAQDLSYVITTGGSSQLVSFQKHVGSRFGRDRVMARDPYNTVVTGLGIEAQGRWAS